MADVKDACVLVVDDEQGVRETLCDLVEMGGCSAVAASNGKEALELLSTRHPCLIILDLLMPVMNGLEVLDALRAEPQLAQIPVIISTSAPRAAPPGFRVVPKPVDIDVLWRFIRDACRCVPQKAHG